MPVIGLLHVHHDRLQRRFGIGPGGLQVELCRLDLGPNFPEVENCLIQGGIVQVGAERIPARIPGDRPATERRRNVGGRALICEASLDLRVITRTRFSDPRLCDTLIPGGHPQIRIIRASDLDGFFQGQHVRNRTGQLVSRKSRRKA